MVHPFVHVELQTRDLPRAKSFYGTLFGWQFKEVEAPDGGSYTLIDVGGGTGGGMYAHPDPGMPSQWLPYVAVADARALTEKARELGAKVCVEAMDIGDFGVMSVFVDPTGAMLALWQEKKPHEAGQAP